MNQVQQIIKLLQKLAAREFLWLVAAVLLGFPLAFCIQRISALPVRGFSFHPHITEELGGQEEIAWAFYYIISAAGIYLGRLVFSSIKLVFLSPEKSKA